LLNSVQDNSKELQINLEEKKVEETINSKSTQLKTERLSCTGWTGESAPVHPKATGYTGALAPVHPDSAAGFK